MPGRPRIVIVGAGFAGLAAARGLEHAPVDVLVVDRANYHTFQPLLYQVATAGLDGESVGLPVRSIFRKQANCDFLQAEVVGVDWPRRLLLADRTDVRYDVLVLSAGAVTATYGVEGVERYAFGLKSLPDALALRSHVLRKFEQAAADPRTVDHGALTFVIAGGGTTGVELGGALGELFATVLRRDYRGDEVDHARVVLLEASDHLLAGFGPSAQRHALDELRRRGLAVRFNSEVVGVTADTVRLQDGSELRSQTLIWAAGARGSPLADRVGLELTRGSRIAVDATLRVPGHDDVYVAGDLAGARDPTGALYPQVAAVAIQQGQHVARLVAGKLAGRPATPFRYHDRGRMATIGRHAAVVELPHGIRFSGAPAWVAWLVLHLVTLMGFRNRTTVLVNWAWNYLTYDRAARLILDVEYPAAGRAP